MDNSNINIISPSKYYDANPQRSNKPQKGRVIAIVLGALGVVLAITIIVATIIFANGTSTTSPNGIIRENSPTLELYSNLEEEMALSALQEAVARAGATITVEDGAGTIQFADDPINMIFFAIDRESDSNTAAEDDEYTMDYDEYYDSEGNYVPLSLEDYAPSDMTTFFRFAHTITEPTDDPNAEPENIGISFVEADEDDGTEAGYEVYDGYEFFLFPTKKEAIEAYLSPDTNK